MIKTTREYLNDLLNPFGAKVSIENSCVQSVGAGYVGEIFKESKKVVKDFQIVSIKDNSCFANINSNIYKKIPREVLNEVFNSYFETSKTIYC